GRSGPEGLAAALTHGARAVTLGADSPVFYAGMARLAYSVPELSMKAAREAVRRDPALLVEMVDLYQPMGFTEAEWLTIVPEHAVDRLDLAMVLGARGRRAESLAAYRAALTVAPPRSLASARWMRRWGCCARPSPPIRATPSCSARSVRRWRAGTIPKRSTTCAGRSAPPSDWERPRSGVPSS